MCPGPSAAAWCRKLAMLAAWLIAGSAQAHLMVAQHGTLNIVGDGAYMVMSLPVSAFSGIDDDGDGRLSLAEGNAHLREVEDQVRSGVQLIGAAGPLPLQGLMVNLSPADNAPGAPVSQIVVVGRFPLGGDRGTLVMKQTLFGKGATEQSQEVTVTRGQQRQLMVLAPGREQRDVLPSSWSVFVDHALQGAEHVLGGIDHLLFLLVVLATGWSLRQTLLALTCFTIGHAMSLSICLWGGWVASSNWVEPAIAATIVGMVLFDQGSKRRARPWPEWVRLGLVFGCSLIHGLGLAEALTSLGLDRENLLLSLAGFNLGIEAAQVAVAIAAAGLLLGLQSIWGPRGSAMAARLASLSAFAAGSAWLVQRLAEAA